jgi:hypothetical protein
VGFVVRLRLIGSSLSDTHDPGPAAFAYDDVQIAPEPAATWTGGAAGLALALLRQGRPRR